MLVLFNTTIEALRGTFTWLLLIQATWAHPHPWGWVKMKRETILVVGSKFKNLWTIKNIFQLLLAFLDYSFLCTHRACACSHSGFWANIEGECELRWDTWPKKCSHLHSHKHPNFVAWIDRMKYELRDKKNVAVNLANKSLPHKS